MRTGGARRSYVLPRAESYMLVAIRIVVAFRVAVCRTAVRRCYPRYGWRIQNRMHPGPYTVSFGCRVDELAAAVDTHI